MSEAGSSDAGLVERLGRGLRAHRESAGLSQSTFAAQLDIHPSYLSSLERGERNVSLSVLERLAGQLGVDPRLLLYPELADEGGFQGRLIRRWC